MSKKRWEYLDILKTIAIICVCSYHFSWAGDSSFHVEGMSITILNNRFWAGMWSICMPLFFMVNGALLLNKKELDYKRHLYKIVSIGIAFLIWRGITIIILGMSSGALKTSGIIEVINAIIFGGKITGIDTAHFWFVPLLVSIYIIYPFIYELYAKKNKWLYFFMAFLLVSCFLFGDISSVLKNISACESINVMYIFEFNPFKKLNCGMLFYFILGGWLHRERERFNQVPAVKMVAIFFVGQIVLFVQWFLVSKSSGSNWDNVFNGYTTTATLLMSISVYVLVYKCSGKIMKCEKLSTCFEIVGNNTLGIYYIWSYVKI